MHAEGVTKPVRCRYKTMKAQPERRESSECGVSVCLSERDVSGLPFSFER